MKRILLLIAAHCYPISAAMATTGWDRHDVTIAGFRIHGANGASFVHRVGENRAHVGPALCSNIDANRTYNGLGCPPDYAVTRTHIAVRYPIRVTVIVPRNHFLIRLDDGYVTGPLTEAEFRKLELFSQAELQWVRPLTASDRLHRFIVGVEICVLLTVLAIAAATILWFRQRRSLRTIVQSAGSAVSNA
jgi:hypothetical protein